MSKMAIGLCTLKLYLPGVVSLKEKRGILKSMLARLHNTFNISTAEVDAHDLHQTAIIAFVSVSNSAVHEQNVIRKVVEWIEEHFPDVMITHEEIEIL